MLGDVRPFQTVHWNTSEAARRSPSRRSRNSDASGVICRDIKVRTAKNEIDLAWLNGRSPLAVMIPYVPDVSGPPKLIFWKQLAIASTLASDGR